MGPEDPLPGLRGIPGAYAGGRGSLYKTQKLGRRYSVGPYANDWCKGIAHPDEVHRSRAIVRGALHHPPRRSSAEDFDTWLVTTTETEQ